jgi:RNA recognition motif-containing protein
MSVKVLICGDVHSRFEVLVNRLNALQNSAHGPFHVLFIVGSLFVDSNDFATFINSGLELPLPAYVLKPTGFPGVADLPNNVHAVGTGAVGFATINQLTVAYISESADDASISGALHPTHNAAYKGCDMLLSSAWPRDIQHFLSPTDHDTLKNMGGMGSGSKSVAEFAAKVIPRYHFAADKSHNIFYQRPPYSNQTGAGVVPTRFISLASVSDSKDKDKKWLHALSLEPIIYLSAAALTEVPAGTTDCPFIQVGKTKPQTAPMDAQAAKRLRPDANGANHSSAPPPPPYPPGASRFGHLEQAGPASGSFFFGGAGCSALAGGSRQYGGQNNNQRQAPPSDQCRVLFVGGIGNEVPDVEILKSFPNSVAVRRVEGKGFVFVEFRCHSDALAVMETSYNQDVIIRGKRLKFGWGKDKDGGSSGGHGGHGHADDLASKQLLLQPPSHDATRLFIGGLPFVVSQEDILGMFPGSISVHHSPGRPYLFLEFCDHESAAECVAAAQLKPVAYQDRTLAVGWAEHNATHGNGSGHRYKLDMTPPYADCRTVFVGGLPASELELSKEDLQVVLLQQLQELRKENNDGRSDRSDNTSGSVSTSDIVTIRRADGKEFAFVEFGSTSDAKQFVDLQRLSVPVKDQTYELAFGWAKGKPVDQYSSHNEDCWFCLGSPSVKVQIALILHIVPHEVICCCFQTHLIISVSDHSYVALPKGGIVDYHVMISPIECVPNRLLLSKGELYSSGFDMQSL